MEVLGRRQARLTVELAAALLVATALSDLLGAPKASFYLLVAGIPLSAVAGLVCYGRVVDAGERGERAGVGRLQAWLLALLVGAIVLGAAVREPALGDGSVPSAATAALVLGLVLLAAQALIALRPAGR